jgi:hypothetical protein
VVERLDQIARHDWKHSHLLDLSDEGLLADLEERAAEATQLGTVDGGAKKKWQDAAPHAGDVDQPSLGGPPPHARDPAPRRARACFGWCRR